MGEEGERPETGGGGGTAGKLAADGVLSSNETPEIEEVSVENAELMEVRERMRRGCLKKAVALAERVEVGVSGCGLEITEGW